MDPGVVARKDGDLDLQIGFGMDPILPASEIELGYDSDPGEVAIRVDTQPGHKTTTSPLPINTPTNIAPKVHLKPKFHEVRNDVAVVQETFNMTWNLTWHPGKNDNHQNPVCVSAWIERGTLIPDSMIEPALMWRETYQPGLASQRKLNQSTKKPFSIRLLSLCRVREAEHDFDRTQYPLARASRCIFLRAVHGQEYLLETKSVRERDEIMWRWKQTIARFAMLAVLEDVQAIHKEFFIPSGSSTMLVPDYNEVE